MREKELRIALVCFGGVSLAVYMHGISKEILKLVRASSTLHAITDRGARANTSFAETAQTHHQEHDTEPVYFDLLRDIGRKVDLRVIVDIVAGASAGGINGTMLARALSHDLAFDGLRDLWLDNGDVSVLLASRTGPGRFVRRAFGPLFSGAAVTGLLPFVRDREVRQNITKFVGARWFKPPFDGRRMASLMYDAVKSLGEPAHPLASLIPSRQKLDLYVTLTNFHGLLHQLQIQNPPLVHEREHRHVLHFEYQRSQSGTIDSDFDQGNLAALAFAARATSAFPGAFPPAQIAEVDDIVAERGDGWLQRQRFLERNFARFLQAGTDPTFTAFIDGGVLNNRPFREAIAAIHGRPAYRQVDRRLVYIDPNPTVPMSTREGVPGFLATLKGAISDLPRAQPMTDELNWVIDFNDRVKQMRSIIEGARPGISRHVADIIEGRIEGRAEQAITPQQIARWREEVNVRVARDAGFAYQGYVRLKLANVISFVSRLIASIKDVAERSPQARVIAATVEAWCARNGVAYREGHLDAVQAGGSGAAPLARWARYLLAFDVDYRMRRINFLIEGQNRLYRLVGNARYHGLGPAAVDRLKRELYGCLDELRQLQEPRSFSQDVKALVDEIFPDAPIAEEMRHLASFAERYADDRRDRLSLLMDMLAEQVGLDKRTSDIDTLLAGVDGREWPADAYREVLINYLGFPYWDVLTLPVATTREAGEFREILVERISPLDAMTLTGFNGADCLKGTSFNYFAAFLSRAYRENDYLLGRLHAIDRLIDILIDASGTDVASGEINVAAIKKRAFARVVDSEQRHMKDSSGLVGQLERALMGLGT